MIRNKKKFKSLNFRLKVEMERKYKRKETDEQRKY